MRTYHETRVSAATASSRRRGFSLIEVLLSVPILAFMLLAAIYATQAASRALGAIARQAEWNNLLRQVWSSAEQEADYWRSHADPEAPYLAGAASSDLAGVLPDQYARPLFRRVAWDVSPFAGPTSIASPASMQRSLIFPEPTTVMRSTIALTPRLRLMEAETTGTSVNDVPAVRPDEVILLSMSNDPQDIEGWYGYATSSSEWLQQIADADISLRTSTSNEASTMGKKFMVAGFMEPNIENDGSMSHTSTGAVRPALQRIPGGWSPWHVAGSVAGAGSAGHHVDVAGTSAKLQWKVYQELGHIGVAGYLPRGTWNLIARPADNRLAAGKSPTAAMDPSMRYDWGEVPWMMAAGTSGSSSFTSYNPADPTVPPPTVGGTRVRVLGNMSSGMPGGRSRALAPRFATSWQVGPGPDADMNIVFKGPASVVIGNSLQDARQDNGSGSSMILCDYDYAQRPRPYTTQYGGGSAEPMYMPRATYGMVYPVPPVIRSETRDPFTLHSMPSVDPFRRISDDQTIVPFGGADLFTYKPIGIMHKESVEVKAFYGEIATRELPAGREFTGTPSSSITARMHVRRVRMLGERLWLSCELSADTGGDALMFQASLVGANYVGARLHWGRLTSVDRTDLPPMGDTRL
jgi:type II secretory pathway pseudopilin PulG